jgi:hypothetical protein
MDSRSLIRFSRRRFLAGTAAIAAGGFALEVIAEEVVKDIADLKPDEFVWNPNIEPDGPVAVVVSLPEQRVHVFRNGVRIAVSTCSTGKPGHDTPAGVFVVLQKDKDHHSSTYNNAPMPYMNRLTWSGIALHAGNLPGYPASHGCVRLPLDFSEKLFTVTHLGTPVIIAGAASDPWSLTHPGMVLGAYAESEFEQIESTLSGKKQPSDWAEADIHPIITAVGSSADQKILLLENGNILSEGKLTVKGGGSVGNHVFVLKGPHDGVKGMEWISISYQPVAGDAPDPEAAILQRLDADDAFFAQMRAKMHPGMIMILTDAPLDPSTRSGDGFVIMS